LGNVLDQSLLSTKISPALSNVVAKMGQGSSGLEIVTINGVENFIIFTPIPEVGYSLAIVVPSQELLTGAATARAQIAQSTRNSLLLGGLLVAIVLVLAFLAALAIGNRLMLPLKALTSAAEEITRGNLNVEAKVQEQDEIGLLATTFNNMTSQLRNMIGTLEQRVAARTKELATSTEVSRKLSTILDRDKLVKEVVEQLVTAFNFYYAHIYLYDRAKETLIMVGGTGEAGRTMLARGHSIPKGRGLVGRAAETNAVVLVRDTSKEPGWLPNELLPETRSEIAVPISIGDEVLGVFDVQHNVVNGLTEENASLLQSLAGQVAISLQNARSIEQSQSQAELESLVNAIGQKIQGTTTIEDTLKVAVRELGLALKAERSSVQLNLHAGEDGRN
jgi:nitrate/nitrite-specific signal transduction histidine kinase